MNMRVTPAARAHIAGVPAETGAWSVLRSGFEAVAGSSRLLLYDLPHAEIPARASPTGIAVRGSPRWGAYLGRRRQLDDGDLTLILALRKLKRSERLLAVDWGTAYSNAFLLIEPREPGVDLSDPDDPLARDLRIAAEAASSGRSGPESRPPSSPGIEAILRRIYGQWIYFPFAPPREDAWREVDLLLDDASATLLDRLRRALRDVFPPEAFDEQLKQLVELESELFAGRSVERARSPFLTRLGLPTVYEPSLVTRALRRLVNDGRLSAYAMGGIGSFQGPQAPVPEDMPDELFERMLL